MFCEKKADNQEKTENNNDLLCLIDAANNILIIKSWLTF